MKSNILVVAIVVGFSLAAFASSITGTVSGVTGQSVVYVDAIAGKTFSAPTQHPIVDQKGLMFVPHLTVVLTGTTVDFLNSDSVAHNVFWTNIGGNKKLAHNLGTWPKGEKHSFKFDGSGAVPMFCNVHPEMTGYIFVVPTPYFATTDASGSYKIENVPDGSYTVSAWHEGSKSQSKTITVSGDSKADFTLSK
jgi:plastocyanin